MKKFLTALILVLTSGFVFANTEGDNVKAPAPQTFKIKADNPAFDNDALKDAVNKINTEKKPPSAKEAFGERKDLHDKSLESIDNMNNTMWMPSVLY